MWQKIKDIFKLPFFILLIVIGLILLAIQHSIDWIFDKINFNLWTYR